MNEKWYYCPYSATVFSGYNLSNSGLTKNSKLSIHSHLQPQRITCYRRTFRCSVCSFIRTLYIIDRILSPETLVDDKTH